MLNIYFLACWAQLTRGGLVAGLCLDGFQLHGVVPVLEAVQAGVAAEAAQAARLLQVELSTNPREVPGEGP